MKKGILILIVGVALMALAACAPSQPTDIKLMLDWVPNTNHSGLYVAQEKGYFKDAGLNVTIIQPGEVYPEQAVASGAADFGVSFQEQITLSRAQTPPAPLVSLAAIIQHNTSGFASLAEKNVKSPADFEGLKYGGFDTPYEAPTLKGLMDCAHADYSKLQTVSVGSGDPVALLSAKQIDLAWVFYGVEGIQAQQQGMKLNFVMLSDHTDCIPDYYTPVLITSEAMIKNKPDMVRVFMKAVSKGYQDAIANPDEAATILQKAAPEMGLDFVKASQEWISPRYQADAPRWGEQKLSVWQGYSEWMAKNKIISTPIDAQAAFTNDFLP